MNRLNHPLARGASYLLIYLTALQPLHPAIAAGISAAGSQTQVITGPGNVPIVNIATPNGAGISHNTFKEFNVGVPGAVLNNATQGGRAQLGTEVESNPNLRGGAAELIINEVTGGSRSELNGQLEVFGSRAGVIIANPDGISCDGCGFINTPGVTLTTGKPQFDRDGALEVKRGTITVGSKGLDGSAQDYVDIISRATELNGRINARSLSLTQGANKISLTDGTISPITGEGAKPRLAVDTKALGGMYANRIRLVANEDGVGVNLNNINSSQHDITLSVAGRIELGNASAKSDLNASAREIHLNPGVNVRSENSITLAADTITNGGKINAKQDMRIFADTLDNTGFLQSGNNLWVQKDAQGNKSQRVDNRSALIQTRSGDLVIRTAKLDNTSKELPDDAPAIKPPEDAKGRKIYNGGISFANGGNTSLITSGKNLYINATSLSSRLAVLTAQQNAILTGDTLFTENREQGMTDNGAYFYRTQPARLMAGGDFVADFSQSLTIGQPSPYDASKSGITVTSTTPFETISAKNILLHTKNATLADGLRASEKITLLADDSAALSGASLVAGSETTLTAVNNLDLWQSKLKGQDITLISRNGAINSYSGDGPVFYPADDAYWPGSLEASRDLTLEAGNSITLNNTLLPARSRHIAMIAGGEIAIQKNITARQLAQQISSSRAARPQQQFDAMSAASQVNASGSILLNSATAGLSLKGITLSAGEDISLFSGRDIDLSMRTIDKELRGYFPESRESELRSQLNAGGNLLINAARDIELEGINLRADGAATLLGGRQISLSDRIYSAADGKNSNTKDDRHITASLHGVKGLTLTSNGAITASGASLTSDDNLTLTAGGDIRFGAVQNRIYRGGGDNYSETITQQGSTLKAAGLMTIIADGSILFQATRIVAGKVLDIAAQGGYLYAKAMEETSYSQQKTVKKNWWGRKKTTWSTHHEAANKVTEFTADGDINLLSHDDSTYEASKIAAGENARLTSTHGKVNFRAVKNRTFEQTVTISKGVYVKQSNRGYDNNTWQLPTIYTGGKLTVDAAEGISADVVAKRGQTLENVLTALGNQPGTTWLKDLSARDDVQWSVVKEAYNHWDNKRYSLNPVLGALLAIAAAAATAGTGLAAAAGNSAIAVTGAAGSAAPVVYGSAYAGMTSLTAQAAVALAESRGNLSQALNRLGSSATVKATVTAMATGGALAGFDQMLGIDVPADKARLPALIKDEGWSRIAQRVAGQSVISSGLNTTINGGSFRDNLTNALLGNIGSQLGAEGANLIGDNGDVLGVAGKSLSHAVVAGVAAEIGGSDGRGAGAGALAAELAGIILRDSLFEPANLNERERQLLRLQQALNGSEAQEQTARVIGALAGALVNPHARGRIQRRRQRSGGLAL